VLMGERLNQGSEGKQGGIGPLIAYAANTPRDGGTALDSGSVRVSLASAYAEELAEKYFQARLLTMVSRGENPGALASMVKLAYTNRYQKTSGLAMELRGLAGLAPPEGDTETRRIQDDYIWSTALRVAGGADEVLRNQISERILGMPGEIRTDKNVPFDQL
jgi:alkylation response protein AidB-like acyl-CoA dehydrogenase